MKWCFCPHNNWTNALIIEYSKCLEGSYIPRKSVEGKSKENCNLVRSKAHALFVCKSMSRLEEYNLSSIWTYLRFVLNCFVIAAGFILLSYHMCENCTFKIKEDDSCPTSVQKQKKTKTNTNSHTFCIR